MGGEVIVKGATKLWRKVKWFLIVSCAAVFGIYALFPSVLHSQPPNPEGVIAFKDPAGLCTVMARSVAKVRVFYDNKSRDFLELSLRVRFNKPATMCLQLPLDEAHDNTGQTLLIKGIEVSERLVPVVAGAPKGELGTPTEAECRYQLGAPNPAAKSIALIRGRLKAIFCADYERVILKNPIEAKGRTVEGKIANVTLRELRERNGSFEASFLLDIKRPPEIPIPEEVKAKSRGIEFMSITMLPFREGRLQVLLIDAAGIAHSPQEGSVLGGKEKIEVFCRWAAKLGGIVPQAIEVHMPSKFEAVEVPFELRNIPLP